MSQFSRWLNDLLPWTGRCIREDGSVINMGDAVGNARDFSGSISSIDHEHRLTHLGRAYIAEFILYLSVTTEQVIVLQTGDPQTHIKEVEVSPDNDEVVMMITEDGESTGGSQTTFAVDGISGLSMQPNNLNRRSSNVSSLQVLTGATILTLGTNHITLKFLPGSAGIGQETSGSDSQDNWERVLKSNHRYNLWVKRLSGTGTTRVKIKLKFYEVLTN